MNSPSDQRVPLADLSFANIGMTPQPPTGSKRGAMSPFARQTLAEATKRRTQRTNENSEILDGIDENNSFVRFDLKHTRDRAQRQLISELWKEVYAMPSAVELQRQHIKELNDIIKLSNLERKFTCAETC